VSDRRAAILLHGLGWGRPVMWALDRALTQAGWVVANVGYPSLRRPLGHHATSVSRIARALHRDGAGTVALVGHSLGGLVARAAAAHAGQDGWPLGRMVLIGSPARGSAIADRLKRFAPFRLIQGGVAVTPAEAAKVPVPATEIAIIAGGNGGRGYNPFLRGDNDGVVTVAETRLPGAETDFLLLPFGHTTLPLRRATVAVTLKFLETGRLA